jgi:hypothetical protein
MLMSGRGKIKDQGVALEPDSCGRPHFPDLR